MRVRSFMRRERLARRLTLTDALVLLDDQPAISRADLSRFERGHQVPTDPQARLLERVYGPRDGWYPATVAHALAPDPVCRKCGKPLDPAVTARVRYHPNCPRRRTK